MMKVFGYELDRLRPYQLSSQLQKGQEEMRSFARKDKAKDTELSDFSSILANEMYALKMS